MAVSTLDVKYKVTDGMLEKLEIKWKLNPSVEYKTGTWSVGRNNSEGFATGVSQTIVTTGGNRSLEPDFFQDSDGAFVNNTRNGFQLLELKAGYLYTFKFFGKTTSNESYNETFNVKITTESTLVDGSDDETVENPGLPTDTDNPDTTFTAISGSAFVDKYAIRQRISDAIETGYTDDELCAYINDALNMIWSVMIQMDYDEAANYLTMTERKIEIPEDYWMPTGKPPVQRYKHTLFCYGDLPCTFRYWMRPPFISGLNKNLPQGTAWFNPALMNLMAQIVVSLAMTNHGFDMGTEMDFTTSIAKLLPK